MVSGIERRIVILALISLAPLVVPIGPWGCGGVAELADGDEGTTVSSAPEGEGSNEEGNGDADSSNSTTAAVLSSTYPAANATNIARNTGIQIAFSSGMKRSSVTSLSFTVKSSSGLGVEGSFFWNEENTIVVFDPNIDLTSEIVYQVCLTSSIKDKNDHPLEAYCYTFTSGNHSDATSPTLSSTSPASGAKGVATNSGIQITFSETMNATTITSSSFKISGGPTTVSGSLSWNNEKTAVTLTPSSALGTGTKYTVTLDNTIKDIAGNSLSTQSFEFTTGSGSAPTIASISPSTNATEITKKTQVVVTFSEEMESSTITSNTFFLKEGAANVHGTISFASDRKQFTFAPSADHLDPITTYCMNLTTGIKSAAGMALANNTESCFTTKCPNTDYLDNSKTLSCFTLFKGTAGAFTTETRPGSYLDSISLSIDNLNLDFNTTNSNTNSGKPFFMKKIDTSANNGNFEVEIYVDDANFTADGNIIGLSLIAIDNPNGPYDDWMSLQLWRDGGQNKICPTSLANGSSQVGNACTVISNEFATFKIAKSGQTYTASYKTTGDYTQLFQVTRNAAGDTLADLSGNIQIGIDAESGSTLGTFTPAIGWFTFISGSAAGQE